MITGYGQKIPGGCGVLMVKDHTFGYMITIAGHILILKIVMETPTDIMISLNRDG